MQMFTLRRLIPLILLAALIGSGSASLDSETVHAQTDTDSVLLVSRLGLTFISSAQQPADEARYQLALRTGAGWNRWPLYWHEVERAPGSFVWDAYDAVIRADLEHGFQIDAILLGRPNFRTDGQSIAGLYAPIFADGTDAPGPNKAINPRNLWADFVARVVARYRPGGDLARSLGWPSDRGIRVWEIWNEPDFSFFWNAPPEDYVRLLKVAYLVIHQTDPEAQVMFGGLAYTHPETDDRFAQFLRLITQDADHRRYNFYFDLVGVHNYSYAERAAFIVNWVQDRLREVGAGQHPIWLNESGVPVWDDYPGPVWVDTPEERVLRANMEEQAAFVIQNATLAWSAGAEVVFHHQLYDDCGNQAIGTDFAPHGGELCVGDFQCWGDAYGLYRNPAQAACFRQHPQAGTPRPSALAYRLLARVFGRAPFQSVETAAETDQAGPDNAAARLMFYRPGTRERIDVLWNRTGQPIEVEIAAAGGWAALFDMAGTESVLWAENGVYRLTLPPATNQNSPYLRPGDRYPIGGPPSILIEYDPGHALNAADPGIEPSATMSPSLPQPGSTADIASDLTPPIPAMQPLPAQSPPVFEVRWGAEDVSGIARYVVWVRVDGGAWQTWLETDRTFSQYTGETGRTYEFAVWAVDRAGNWSPNVALTPMAGTTVGPIP